MYSPGLGDAASDLAAAVARRDRLAALPKNQLGVSALLAQANKKVAALSLAVHMANTSAARGKAAKVATVERKAVLETIPTLPTAKPPAPPVTLPAPSGATGGGAQQLFPPVGPSFEFGAPSGGATGGGGSVTVSVGQPAPAPAGAGGLSSMMIPLALAGVAVLLLSRRK